MTRAAELAYKARIRRVRTLEGVRQYGQPIGTIITPDMERMASRGVRPDYVTPPAKPKATRKPKAPAPDLGPYLTEMPERGKVHPEGYVRGEQVAFEDIKPGDVLILGGGKAATSRLYQVTRVEGDKLYYGGSDRSYFTNTGKFFRAHENRIDTTERDARHKRLPGLAVSGWGPPDATRAGYSKGGDTSHIKPGDTVVIYSRGSLRQGEVTKVTPGKIFMEYTTPSAISEAAKHGWAGPAITEISANRADTWVKPASASAPKPPAPPPPPKPPVVKPARPSQVSEVRGQWTFTGTASELTTTVDGAKVIVRADKTYPDLFHVYVNTGTKDVPMTRSGPLSRDFALDKARTTAEQLASLPKKGMKPRDYGRMGRRRPKGETWRDYSYGRRGVDWRSATDPEIEGDDDYAGLAVVVQNDARDLGYKVKQPFPPELLEAFNEAMWAYHAMYPGFPRLIETIKIDPDGMYDPGIVAWNRTLPSRYDNPSGSVRLRTEMNFSPTMWIGQRRDAGGGYTRERDRAAQQAIEMAAEGWWSGRWEELGEDDPEWKRALLHTLHHELGHTVHDAAVFQNPRMREEMWDLLEDMGLGYRTGGLRPPMAGFFGIGGTPADDGFVFDSLAVEVLLSRYGVTNMREFFAEVWTEYMTDSEPREFAARIGAQLAKGLNDYLAHWNLDGAIDAKMVRRMEMETKVGVRRVRTIEGARQYGQAIGTIIRPDFDVPGEGSVGSYSADMPPGPKLTEQAKEFLRGFMSPQRRLKSGERIPAQLESLGYVRVRKTRDSSGGARGAAATVRYASLTPAGAEVLKQVREEPRPMGAGQIWQSFVDNPGDFADVAKLRVDQLHGLLAHIGEKRGIDYPQGMKKAELVERVKGKLAIQTGQDRNLEVRASMVRLASRGGAVGKQAQILIHEAVRHLDKGDINAAMATLLRAADTTRTEDRQARIIALHDRLQALKADIPALPPSTPGPDRGKPFKPEVLPPSSGKPAAPTKRPPTPSELGGDGPMGPAAWLVMMRNAPPGPFAVRRDTRPGRYVYGSGGQGWGRIISGPEKKYGRDTYMVLFPNDLGEPGQYPRRYDASQIEDWAARYEDQRMYANRRIGAGAANDGGWVGGDAAPPAKPTKPARPKLDHITVRHVLETMSRLNRAHGPYESDDALMDRARELLLEENPGATFEFEPGAVARGLRRDTLTRGEVLRKLSDDELDAVGRWLHIRDMTGDKAAKRLKLAEFLNRRPMTDEELLAGYEKVKPHEFGALDPEVQAEWLHNLKRFEFGLELRKRASDLRRAFEGEAPSFAYKVPVTGPEHERRLEELAGDFDFPENPKVLKSWGYYPASDGQVDVGSDAFVWARGKWQRGVVVKTTPTKIHVEYLTLNDEIARSQGKVVKPKIKAGERGNARTSNRVKGPEPTTWVRRPLVGTPHGHLSPASESWPTMGGHTKRGDEVRAHFPDSPAGGEWVTVIGLDPNMGGQPVLWVRDRKGDTRWINTSEVDSVMSRRAPWYSSREREDFPNQYEILRIDENGTTVVATTTGKISAEMRASQLSDIERQKWLRENTIDAQRMGSVSREDVLEAVGKGYMHQGDIALAAKPVLEELVKEGLVELRPGGYYRIPDKAAAGPTTEFVETMPKRIGVGDIIWHDGQPRKVGSISQRSNARGQFWTYTDDKGEVITELRQDAKPLVKPKPAPPFIPPLPPFGQPSLFVEPGEYKPPKPPKPGTGEYTPKPLTPGAPIVWSHRAPGVNSGVERTGQIWSEGPLIGGQGSFWVIPDEPLPGDVYSAILVRPGKKRRRGAGAQRIEDPAWFYSEDADTSDTGSIMLTAARRAEAQRRSYPPVATPLPPVQRPSEAARTAWGSVVSRMPGRSTSSQLSDTMRDATAAYNEGRLDQARIELAKARNLGASAESLADLEELIANPPAGADSWWSVDLPEPSPLSVLLAPGLMNAQIWEGDLGGRANADSLIRRGLIQRYVDSSGFNGQYTLTPAGQAHVDEAVAQLPGSPPMGDYTSDEYLRRLRQRNELEKLGIREAAPGGTIAAIYRAIRAADERTPDGAARIKKLRMYLARELFWREASRRTEKSTWDIIQAVNLEYDTKAALELEMKQAVHGEIGGRVAALLSPGRRLDFKAGAEEARKTGAMIALLPTKGWAQRLAIPGGERPEELHLTLGFLGKAMDWSYGDRDAVVSAVRDVAGKYGKMLLRAFNVSLFNPKTDNACMVLGVGGPNLADLHDQLWEKLEGFKTPRQHTPWTPHVTLAYQPSLMRLPEGIERTGIVTFDRIGVYFGGDVVEIPLSGSKAASEESVAADAETKAMEWQFGQVASDGILIEEKFLGLVRGLARLARSKTVRKAARKLGGHIASRAAESAATRAGRAYRNRRRSR